MSTPRDPLQDLLNDFDAVSAAPAAESPAPRARKAPRDYRSGLRESQTDRRQAAKATGKRSSVAGNYIRRSFTFRPDQLDAIEAQSTRLGLSQNDVLRWFTDLGLAAIARGERPPVAAEVRHRYTPPAG